MSGSPSAEGVDYEALADTLLLGHEPLDINVLDRPVERPLQFVVASEPDDRLVLDIAPVGQVISEWLHAAPLNGRYVNAA
jgi:hypothetical protein